MDSPSTSSPHPSAIADDNSNSAPPLALNSSGTLRTKISLRKGDAQFVSPFMLMRPDLPRHSALSGSTNLLCHYGLDEVYKSVSSVKRELSAFLPNVPGNVDNPMQHTDSSSLKALIEKPPITGKEIHPLSSNQLAGFKLNVGSLPDDYRAFCLSVTGQDSKQAARPSKHKRSLEMSEQIEEAEVEKKKKQRKEDDKRDKKKKKKEKKKKVEWVVGKEIKDLQF